MAINLPLALFFRIRSRSAACARSCQITPLSRPHRRIKSAEVVRNLNVAKDLARQLRLHKIAISIDDLGAEWLSLTGLSNFPFVEFKVDRRFVTGCVDDPLKQSIQQLWRTHRRRRRRDLVGFPHGSRHGLRSGARVAVRQAHERREVRADLLGRTASRSFSGAVKVHGPASIRQPSARAE